MTEGMTVAYSMRQACVRCGCLDGYVEERNGQACVFCSGCGAFQYNAPKKERGLVPETVRTEDIPPSLRYKVAERANFRCEFCGKDSRASTFHIGHLISLKEIQNTNLPIWLHKDLDNLAWLCAECNLGMGDRSLNIHELLVWKIRRNANGE